MENGMMAQMVAAITNLLYPQRCPLCNQIRPYGEGMVCGTCLEALLWVQGDCCLKCGKPVYEDEEYCGDCKRLPKSFKRGFPAFLYEGRIKDSLYDFKYKNQRPYAAFYADCIMKQYGKELQELGIDGLVPIPVHPNRLRKRGYNQAALLAKQLGNRLCIPVYPEYLKRCVDTNPQKELNDKARKKNLKAAFIVGNCEITLKKVLIIDDIYTSGATIEACTRVLLEAGADEVYYTSVAIGRGYLDITER